MVYRRIKDLREDFGLTQTDIAKLLNTTQRTYSRYETGANSTIPLDILIKLADIYNVSIDYLLERTDIAKPYPKTQNRRKQK
ncbi:MAG: helix-turn-helix domain-containing protein [Clostridia bacterium]|nr:helix-turn-helix domain-containing protein [Clostridia bacterium]